MVALKSMNGIICNLGIAILSAVVSEAGKSDRNTRSRFRQRVRRTGTLGSGAGGAGFVNAGLHLEPWEIALIVGGVGCCILIVLCMCCKTKRKKAQEQQEYKTVSEAEESIQLQDRPTNCSDRRDSYPLTSGYHSLKRHGAEQDEEETTSYSRLSPSGNQENTSQPLNSFSVNANGNVVKDQSAQSDFADVTFSKEGQPSVVINSSKLPYMYTPTDIELPQPISIQPHLAVQQNTAELNAVNHNSVSSTHDNNSVQQGEEGQNSSPISVPPPNYADVVNTEENEPFIRFRGNSPPKL